MARCAMAKKSKAEKKAQKEDAKKSADEKTQIEKEAVIASVNKKVADLEAHERQLKNEQTQRRSTCHS